MGYNELKLFQQAITACNINSTIIFKDQSNLSQVDQSFRLRLYEDFHYKHLLMILEQWLTPAKLIRFEDDFGIFYFFLSIPDSYLHDYESSYFIIGPYLDGAMEPEQIHQIMDMHGFPKSLYEDIRLVYHSTPVIIEMTNLESLVLNLARGLFQVNYEVLYLPDHNERIMEHSPLILKLREHPQISMSTIEDRYEVEAQMLEAVSLGDDQRAHEMYQKFKTFQLRPRTDNQLQNKRHGVIILNTLFRKAIQSGGVHPLYIDDLSGKIAILINEARSERELDRLSDEMVHKYCLLAKNYSMKGYSDLIKKVVSYIDFHYAEDLSLNFFAEMLHISKNYLSGLFKKETAVTLTDYIHQVRIRRAMTLINSSSLSISTIANSCGYQDINYFIRIFKRAYGMSPKQYQKLILRPEVKP